MHDLITDFETVTPDLWISNELAWKERLLKLPNWYQVLFLKYFLPKYILKWLLIQNNVDLYITFTDSTN